MAISFNQKLSQSRTGFGRRSLRSAKRAFTLVELLIATGITIVIAGMMVAVTTQVLNAWTRSSDTLEMNQTARIVLDFLASDLQSAAFRNDRNVWMRAELRPPQGGGRTPINPGNLPSGTPSDFQSPPTGFRLGNALFGEGVFLRFFAPTLDRFDGLEIPPDQREVGGINALGYMISRQNVTNVSGAPDSSIRYIIYRKRIRDRETFNRGYNIIGPEYNDLWIDDDDNRNRSMLGLNVIDFGVVFYDRRGNIIFPISDSPDPIEFPVSGRAPAFADVSVRILTGEGADILNLVETGRLGALPDGMTIQDFLNTYSQVFTRRVQILSQPL